MAGVTRTLKDAAYVAVGFSVLAFQKAQVRRRELEKQFVPLFREIGSRIPTAYLSKADGSASRQ